MFLSNFHIIDPPYCMSQDDCLNWMASSYVSYQNSQKFSFSEYQKLLKRAGCYSTQIEKRYFFLPDFNSPKIEPGGNQRVFKHGSIGGTNARQEFFQEVTMEVFENLYDQRPVPPFLIHVTCTGYGSPSAAQVIAAKKSPRTIVTHSYHMGCYGAFPAIRMAMGFLSAPVLRNGEAEAVDIVHTELCTLHMAPQDPTPEQMRRFSIRSKTFWNFQKSKYAIVARYCGKEGI